jgi:hypothetical protein
VHGSECPLGSIVEPAQVQHTVQPVQQQFVSYRNSPCRGGVPGNRHANHHLAGGNAAPPVVIDLEAQHVGWTAPAQKSPVQRSHLRLVNQTQRNMRQARFQQPPGAAQLSFQKWNSMPAG